LAIEFDPDKDKANRAKHGLSLAAAIDLEIEAVIRDERFPYPEPRFRAFGLYNGLPHLLAFCAGSQPGAIRAISFRRAHLKEYRRYVRQG
jgi:uncharacterized DUF497 family protein